MLRTSTYLAINSPLLFYFEELFEGTEVVYARQVCRMPWVKIRGITIKTDLMTGICYRPASEEKEMGHTFFR